MERCFQVAYGRDNLSVETRETILFGQLQEGLRFNIVKSPSVSGSQSYKELCMAAKNEDNELLDCRGANSTNVVEVLVRTQASRRGSYHQPERTLQRHCLSSQLVSAMSVGALSTCHGIARSPSKGESSGRWKKSGEKGSNEVNAKMVKADSNPLSFQYSSDFQDGGVCLQLLE